MENLTWRWAQSGTFFPKIRSFFLIFQERAGETTPTHPPPPPPYLHPSPSCAPVSVAEYASVSLNITKYPCKCLIKLFWLCLGSEYARSSYMFERLLKMPLVLNVTVFWIWQVCICKCYIEFWICLNMAQYASITCLNMPRYASMFLNMPDHDWILLNVPEYAWINCSDYARVLNMPQVLNIPGFWICHDIIIITLLLL